MSILPGIFHLKGIRTRFLFSFGALLTALLMIISILIISQWRQMILKNAEDQVESVTRAFSIFVIETFIFAEDNHLQVNDALDYYINDYLANESRLKYVAIYSPEGEILVHSDPQKFIHKESDSLASRILTSGTPVNSAFEDGKYGWILESAFPLKIAGKKWGVLHMGFEGESVRDELRELFFSFIAFALLVTVIALIMLFFMSGYLTSSLRIFASAIDKFQIDTPPQFEKPLYDDEISTLYTHFNYMHERLKESQDKVMEIQKQIYHAEKLASIGRLASGVAHEINNPLNGIRNCLIRLNKEKTTAKQKEEYQELINEGVTRIEKIVKKLLGFARKEKQSLISMNINEELRKVISLLDYKLTQNNIDLELNLDAELPLVKGDSLLLQEVFMNILLNSFDAVEKNGKINITSVIAENNAVKVSIRDNGSGIKAEDMAKIFDPFFTTKEPGKGTGLGLSVVMNIIEAHGGKIEINSNPEKGTVVTLIFKTEYPDENITD